MAMVSCLCFAESSSHWEQSLRTCVHDWYTRTQKKWKVLTYRGVLSAGGMIYSTRQILLMCLSRVFYRFFDFLLEKGRIKLNPQQLWIFEKTI